MINAEARATHCRMANERDKNKKYDVVQADVGIINNSYQVLAN